MTGSAKIQIVCRRVFNSTAIWFGLASLVGGTNYAVFERASQSTSVHRHTENVVQSFFYEISHADARGALAFVSIPCFILYMISLARPPARITLAQRQRWLDSSLIMSELVLVVAISCLATYIWMLTLGPWAAAMFTYLGCRESYCWSRCRLNWINLISIGIIISFVMLIVSFG